MYNYNTSILYFKYKNKIYTIPLDIYMIFSDIEIEALYNEYILYNVYSKYHTIYYKHYEETYEDYYLKLNHYAYIPLKNYFINGLSQKLFDEFNIKPVDITYKDKWIDLFKKHHFI